MFFKCDNNNNINLPSAPLPIKSLPKGTKLLIPLLMSAVFSAYELPLKMMNSLKYLGQVILAADDDCALVVKDLYQDRKVWSRMSQILSREGATLRVSELFFNPPPHTHDYSDSYPPLSCHLSLFR